MAAGEGMGKKGMAAGRVHGVGRRAIRRGGTGAEPMQAGERRQALLDFLRKAGRPVTGSELAERFGVTRAVIVHDVALLRARGEPIVPTPQGYVYAVPPAAAPSRHVWQVAVRHGPSLEEIERELTTIVDEGARVRDVVVEHPIYGELRGLLMIASRHDVRRFCQRMRETGAEPLLTLAGGVHLHTLEAEDPGALQRVEEALRRLGFLLEDGEAKR
ncbi:MAG TPA: transcription repressor NadR [Thermaerobacter sp.]